MNNKNIISNKFNLNWYPSFSYIWLLLLPSFSNLLTPYFFHYFHPPVANVMKLFTAKVTPFHNKLEHFSLASFSSLSGKARDCPSEAPFRRLERAMLLSRTGSCM
jgi:hypothetical protein